MSRTDKDRPFWVQNAEHGQIDHDHRDGRCVISDDTRDRYPAWRNHWRHCKKRVTVEYTCTRADPHHEKYRNRQTCWLDWREFETDHYMSARVWHHIRCIGHTRVEYDDSIRCACDDMTERATCFASWVSGRYYVHGGVPSWFVRQDWHRPERCRERKLNDMRREYNAYGDIEDDDFENRRARNSSRWHWW